MTRFPELRLAIPASQAKWSRRMGTRGMEELPVLLM